MYWLELTETKIKRDLVFVALLARRLSAEALAKPGHSKEQSDEGSLYPFTFFDFLSPAWERIKGEGDHFDLPERLYRESILSPL